jgi:uncharacterized DUF497 family protein
VADFDDLIGSLAGFEWDAGNADKNWVAHRVSRAECEEVFLHRPVLVRGDATHSTREARYNALGRTAAGRLLSVIFTVRGDLVRVISARAMSRKERTLYVEGAYEEH